MTQHRRGAAGQQYAIVVGLIAVVALAAVARLGGGIDTLFTRTGNVLQTVTNGGAVTAGTSGGTGGGGGTGLCEQTRTSCLAHLNAGCTTSGTYTIDPDDAGGGPAMSASCDQSTDGGGWTLALNYLHRSNTNPAPNARANSLPILAGNTLGLDESGTAAWGHGANATVNLFTGITAVRFYCRTSHTARVMHFKVTGPSATNTFNYFRTGTGSVATTGPVTLTGHSANMPVTNPPGARYSNQGENAMTWFPFYVSSNYHWGIGAPNTNGNDRWECDDSTGSSTGDDYDTQHQIWIR